MFSKLRPFFYLPTSSITCNIAFNNDSSFWHKIFGHPSHFAHKHLAYKYFNISYYINKDFPYYFCHLAKKKRLCYPNSTSISSHQVDILYDHILGPYSLPYISNHKYILTLVYDCTRFTWVIFMAHKSETMKHLINLFSYINTHFHLT